MNVLSCFDGIGCGLQAIKELGWEIDNYFAFEIDENAIKIANKNHPNIIQLGDIRKWKTHDLPKIDLILGGSPCQGFSKMGNQDGFEDPRSSLFFDFVEIVKYYDRSHFLFENVNMKEEWLHLISYYLKIEGQPIDSALVSAQKRLRFYWHSFSCLTVPRDLGIQLQDVLESGQALDTKSYCIDANYWKGGSLKNMMDTSRRTRIVENVDDVQISRLLTPKECERLQTLPDDYTKSVPDKIRYQLIGNGWTVAVIKYLLSYYN